MATATATEVARRVPVIFRAWKDGSGVVALFPDEQHSARYDYCESYAPHGGHCGADYFGVMRATRPATEAEAAPVRAMLEGIGYRLRVVSRASREMHDRRRGIKRGIKAKPVKPSRTLEQVALQQFAAEGEVSGLGVLADWVEENGGSAEYAAALRSVLWGDRDAGAVRFFLWNLGQFQHVGMPQDVNGANCFLGACEFADVEAWFDSLPEGAGWVEWEDDNDADRSWMEDEPNGDDGRPLYGCVAAVEDEHGKEHYASLWGIDFAAGDPWHGPYKRVVEAELKAEVRARIEGK